MQPPGRDGRDGGSHARSMNGGFPQMPAFPGFPDPFAGFGRPGMFMSSMFDNDPFFSDPFFTRPFGNPFGSGGLFGPSPFSSTFFNQGFMGMGQENFLDQRPFNNTPPPDTNRRSVQIEEGPRRGVQIEELSDDHEDVVNGQPSSNHQEPIVEQPDDEDNRNDSLNHQARSLTRYEPRATSQYANNSGTSYSFQSSSVMYGGSNGPYYATQTTRRQGPNGVIEEEHQAKDGTSGRAVHRLSRGLGDRGRSLTRKRNAEGREEKLETLHNLGEEEVQDFERNWETMADKNLPKWNRSSSQRLGSSSRARPAPALPSGGGSRSHGR